MALVNVGRMVLNDPNAWTGAAAVDPNAGWQISATGHRFGNIFVVPKSGTITKVGVRIATLTTAVTSRLGLYTLDAGGNPTTTLYGGSAYGTFTPSANTFSEVTLPTSATAVAGDTVALVCEFDSTAGNYFLTGWGGGAPYQIQFPYQNFYNGSAWAKVARYYQSAFSVGYSDGSYPQNGGLPLASTTAGVSYNSSSSPSEYALAFTANCSARIIGIWHAFNQSSGSDYEARLYNGTTQLTKCAMDGDFTRSYGVNAMQWLYFQTPQVIAPGNTYYASLCPTTVNNINSRYLTVPSSSMVEALGFPSEWSVGQASRTGTGAWTSTPTQVPAIGLLIDQIDNGVSSGAFGCVSSNVQVPLARVVSY
jgi:hypothetical protein